MKRTVLLCILLVAGLVAVSAQQWEEFDLFGGKLYGEKTGSTLKVRTDGLGLVFSGITNEKGAGYALESKTDLKINVNKRIKLVISGIQDTDTFDTGKLLKLELNGKPLSTQGGRGMNRFDDTFLNARDGEYIFDIAQMELVKVLKINFVFYNSTVQNLSVKMYTEK